MCCKRLYGADQTRESVPCPENAVFLWCGSDSPGNQFSPYPEQDVYKRQVDDSLRVFDIIMYTEFGTTYNSYVLKAGDKTILFETAKEKFWDDYLEKLEEVTTVSEIDYLVVSHTEPDHAGSVERLLDMCPHLKIISTGTANGFLKEIVNRDFTGIVVKDGQSMQIGNKTLYFMAVPNLHLSLIHIWCRRHF